MKNKKFVLMAIAIVLVIIFIIFYPNNKKSVIFDLNNTVYSYELSTAKEENEYKKFVFQNIKPEKLKNFIEYNDDGNIEDVILEQKGWEQSPLNSYLAI